MQDVVAANRERTYSRELKITEDKLLSYLTSSYGWILWSSRTRTLRCSFGVKKSPHTNRKREGGSLRGDGYVNECEYLIRWAPF